MSQSVPIVSAVFASVDSGLWLFSDFTQILLASFAALTSSVRHPAESQESWKELVVSALGGRVAVAKKAGAVHGGFPELHGSSPARRLDELPLSRFRPLRRARRLGPVEDRARSRQRADPGACNKAVAKVSFCTKNSRRGALATHGPCANYRVHVVKSCRFLARSSWRHFRTWPTLL